MLRHTQGEPRVEGENWPFADRNNLMRLALLPHVSSFMLICNPSYCFCGCWEWKVESDVVDPGGTVSWLVGWPTGGRSQRCRYSGQRPTLSTHNIWCYMSFPRQITKSKEFSFLWKEDILILEPKWELSRLERKRWKCRIMPGRW